MEFQPEGDIKSNFRSDTNNIIDVQANGDKNEPSFRPSSQEQSWPPEARRQEAADTSGSRGTDVVVPADETSRRQSDYRRRVEELRKAGECLRSDRGQPNLLQKPSWFDEHLFYNAKSVYERHFMGVNFAHLSGLLLLVRVNSIYRTLSATGKSDSVAKLFKRYYHTVIHVKKWYEGDIFEEDSDAHRSLLIVRGMHNNASRELNDARAQADAPGEAGDESHRPVGGHNGQAAESGDANQRQAHISEYDIMITQFAFIGFIVTRAKQVGLIDDFSQDDLESMLHFWRVIGYYLGASDAFNLCARDSDQVASLCEAILEVEFRRSILKNRLDSPPSIMGVNIVRSIKFIPMLTIYGIFKYLYELLDIDTAEFESRATWYSRLSYTLMKLVMSRLLAYKPFRCFNNGLTRFSVYLVGKIEDRFSKHLDSKYGQVLKL